MRRKKIQILIFLGSILLCLIFASCGRSYTWTSGEDITVIPVEVNGDFYNMRTIVPEDMLNVFYGSERADNFHDSVVRIDTRKYTMFPIGFANGSGVDGVPFALYDAEKGVTVERRINVGASPNFWQILYDEESEKILWTRHEREPRFQRQPDELIVLDRELHELWRINIPHYARSLQTRDDLLRAPEHTPFYIMTVEITDEFYYVVSINYMRHNRTADHNVEVIPASGAVTVVYKVDKDGNILDIFRRENFHFMGLMIQDGFYVTYGVQTIDGKAKTIVIHGSGDNILSGEYTVIQAQNLVRHAMIANDILMITGETHFGPRVYYFITLIVNFQRFTYSNSLFALSLC